MDKYNKANDLGELSFFDLLDEEQRTRLERNLSIVKYKKKDVIFRQGTRAYDVMFVKSGLIKVYKEGRNDRILILKVAKKDDYIGLLSVFSEKLHHYSAAALSDCVLYHIDFTTFKSVMLENGKFSFNFQKLLSFDGLYMIEKLFGQSYKQLPGRVADVLLYFSEEIFHSRDFTFPFTRKELAEFSGTTKESFIRTLTEFKNDRIIEIDGASISIKSMDIIRTLSNLG
jgi:CRP/FNR family transcriptional regulator